MMNQSLDTSREVEEILLALIRDTSIAQRIVLPRRIRKIFVWKIFKQSVIHER